MGDISAIALSVQFKTIMVIIAKKRDSQSILVFATTVGSVHSLSHVGAWDETKQGHKDNS